MNCEQVRERLSDLIDGEISDAEGAQVLRHLGACPACREHHDELAGVVAAVRGIPWPDPPEDFAAAIAERLRPHPKPWAKLFWMAPVAAAACLLILAGLRPGPHPEAGVVETSRAPASTRDREVGAPADPASAPRAEVPAPGVSAPGSSEGSLGVGGGAGAVPPPTAPEPPGEESRPVEAAAISKKAAGALAEVDLRVRGLEPDAAAGLLLAELENRRSRATAAGFRPKDLPAGVGRRAAETACEERVITRGDGVPSGLVLCVTPEELEFVRGLLSERAGAEVEKRARPRAEAEPDDGAAAETKAEDAWRQTARLKLRVVFDR